MSIFDDYIIRIESEFMDREIKRERRRALQLLRAEKRKAYCGDIRNTTNSTLISLVKYLDTHTVRDLDNLTIRAIEVKARQEHSRPKWQGYEIDQIEKALDPLFNWLKHNRAPDKTLRHTRLIKNLSIFAVLKGWSDPEIKRWAGELLALTPDKKPADVIHWADWARSQMKEGKKLKVNIGELNRWVEDAGRCFND